MTHRKVKKQQKGPAKRTIKGTVIDFDGRHITLKTRSGLRIIQRTAKTKVISGTLKRGSTVTVEGVSARPQPGKRTEIGTVMGLTAAQIQLLVPSISAGHPGAGTQGTFDITIHTQNDTVTIPALAKLKVGSAASVESNEEDWKPVNA